MSLNGCEILVGSNWRKEKKLVCVLVQEVKGREFVHLIGYFMWVVCEEKNTRNSNLTLSSTYTRTIINFLFFILLYTNYKYNNFLKIIKMI